MTVAAHAVSATRVAEVEVEVAEEIDVVAEDMVGEDMVVTVEATVVIVEAEAEEVVVEEPVMVSFVECYFKKKTLVTFMYIYSIPKRRVHSW